MNTGALMAAASATSVNKDMETSMERLSTGKRINSAKDDAAGVAIASRLTSEIRGTNQAIRNAQDGQALINTAEGAHKEVENILQRMRELATQAANDTNDSTDRGNLQLEMDQLTTEINRIAGSTTWAGQNLLNGSSPTAISVASSHNDKATFNFQVGAGASARDSIGISIGAISATALGVGGAASTPEVAGTSVRSSASERPAALTVQDGTVAVTGSLENGDVFKFDLNGTEISVTFSNSDAYSDDLAGLSAQLKTAIDTQINSSSVSPSLSGMSVVDNGDGSVTLSQSAVPVLDNATVTNTSATTANTMSISGDTVTIGGAFDATDVFSMSVNGVTVSITATATDAYEDSSAGLSAQLADAIRSHSSLSGVSAVDNGDGTVTLSQSTTPTIAAATVTPATAADATLTFEAPTAASVTLTEGSGALVATDTFTVSLDDGKGNAITFTSAALGGTTAGLALSATKTAFDALSDKKGYTFSAAGVIARADGQDFGVTGSTTSSAGTLKESITSGTADLSSTAVTTTSGAAPNTLTIGGDFVDGKSYSVELFGTTVSIVADAADGFENSTAGLAQQLSQAINDAGIAGVTASASNSGVDLIAQPKLSNGLISKDVTTGDATIAFSGGVAEVQTANTSGITHATIDAALTLTIGGETYTTTATTFANDAAIATAFNAVGVTGYTVSSTVGTLVLTSNTTGRVSDTFTLGGGGTHATAVAAATFTQTTAGLDENTITLDGTFDNGDVYALNLNGTDISLTIGADGFANTNAGVAAQLKEAIEAAGLPGVRATIGSTSSAAVVSVDMPLGTLSNSKSTVATNIAVEATPNATLSENDGTLTISGEVAEGDIFTLNVEGTEVTVTAGEDGFEVSEAGVAAQMAAAINTSDIAGVSAKDNGDGTVSLSSVAISVTTAEGAINAIAALDTAIQTLNSQRASLGAVSNRMDNTVSNLTNVVINLEGGRGRIEDADFAAESTALSKAQILQQASTAMLAQANASKQSVLSLLQG